MATPATLREAKFAHLMEQFEAHCTVTKLPAAGLVELVEAGNADCAATEQLLRPLLSPLAGKLDALVLGCTHYPFAAKTISRLLGENTRLYDGGIGTARHTRRRLEDAGLLRQGEGELIIETSLPQTRDLCLSLLEAKL
jgi:glutamate racemase